MDSSWIRDKVVSTVKADTEENGGDANEVIWQLSKELKKMVRFGEPAPGPRIIGSIDAADPLIATLEPGRLIHKPTMAELDGLIPGSPKFTDASDYDPSPSRTSLADRIRETSYTSLSEEFQPESLQGLSDYELAELQVNLRVERQRRIDTRHESSKS